MEEFKFKFEGSNYVGNYINYENGGVLLQTEDPTLQHLVRGKLLIKLNDFGVVPYDDVMDRGLDKAMINGYKLNVLQNPIYNYKGSQN